MTSAELLRKLRRFEVTVDRSRGKGGHIMVRRAGRFAMVPVGKGELADGTLRAILRQLGIPPQDLR